MYINDIDYRTIDKEIRPLIKAMNGTKNIITNSSCYGHRVDANTYIQFFCWQGFVLTLSKILSEAQRHVEEIGCFIECDFVFSDECYGCQCYAPLGYIALNLWLDSIDNKQKAIDILTDKFVTVTETTNKV